MSSCVICGRPFHALDIYLDHPAGKVCTGCILSRRFSTSEIGYGMTGDGPAAVLPNRLGAGSPKPVPRPDM